MEHVADYFAKRTWLRFVVLVAVVGGAIWAMLPKEATAAIWLTLVFYSYVVWVPLTAGIIIGWITYSRRAFALTILISLIIVMFTTILSMVKVTD